MITKKSSQILYLDIFNNKRFKHARIVRTNSLDLCMGCLVKCVNSRSLDCIQMAWRFKFCDGPHEQKKFWDWAFGFPTFCTQRNGPIAPAIPLDAHFAGLSQNTIIPIPNNHRSLCVNLLNLRPPEGWGSKLCQILKKSCRLN